MWVSLSTTYWSSVVQPPPLTYAGCAALLCQIKKAILLICLLWLFLLVTVCVLSLSIPHGMHLVVPTHPYFFWVTCHPSRTFLPKKPEQEPQNRFFPSPHRQTMPFDPWPTTSYIGWVQAGGVWISRVFHLLHSLLIHLSCSRYCSIRSVVHFWLLMVWVVFQSTIFNDLLLLGIRPCWIMGLSSSSLFYVHSVALFLCSCRTILLFLL